MRDERMSKKRILVDFDMTIVNSTSRLIELYQEDTGDYSKPYEGNEDKLTWDFGYFIPKDYNALKYFADPRLMENVKFIDGAKETLEALSFYYDVYIMTRSSCNLDNKIKFIKEELPFVKGTIFVSSSDFTDKALFSNDFDTVLIDDRVDCFYKSNRLNLLFGEYDWNKQEELDKFRKDNDIFTPLYRAKTWSDILHLLLDEEYDSVEKIK